jgi:hypothetical protein
MLPPPLHTSCDAAELGNNQLLNDNVCFMSAIAFTGAILLAGLALIAIRMRANARERSYAHGGKESGNFSNIKPSETPASGATGTAGSSDEA